MLEDNENEGQIHKAFYGIIPGSVRYDANLCPNAKLMYCEITALCDSFGVCWAGNSYFAELYNVSTKSVSNWIGQLEKNNYIRSEYSYKRGTKAIDKRRIYVPSSFYTYGKNVLGGMEDKFHTGIEEKFQGGIEKKFADNNITYKDDYIYTSEYPHTDILPNTGSIPNEDKPQDAPTVLPPLPPQTKPKTVAIKTGYGAYKNVLLSESELSKILERADGQAAIDFLSEYIEMKGYKAKSHYMAICKWVYTALKEKQLKDREIQEREKRLNGGGYSSSKAPPKCMQGSTDYSKLLKRGGE